MGMILLAACTEQPASTDDPTVEPGYSPPRYRVIDLGPDEWSSSELALWMLAPDSTLHHVVVPGCAPGATEAADGCSVFAVGRDSLLGVANSGGPGTGVPAAWQLRDYEVTQLDELDMGRADYGVANALTGDLAGGSLFRDGSYRATLWKRALGAWNAPVELAPLPPYAHAGIVAIDDPLGPQRVLGKMSENSSAGRSASVVWSMLRDEVTATVEISGTDLGGATAIDGKRIVGYLMNGTHQSAVIGGPVWWELADDGTVSEPMPLPLPDGFTAGAAVGVRGNTVVGVAYERPVIGGHALLWHFEPDGSISTFDISPSATAEWTAIGGIDEFGRIFGVHFDKEIDANARHRFALVPDVELVPDPQ